MEARFALAERVKAKANALVKAGRHSFAAPRYERLLRLMESTRDWEDEVRSAACVFDGGRVLRCESWGSHVLGIGRCCVLRAIGALEIVIIHISHICMSHCGVVQYDGTCMQAWRALVVCDV
jgi:hypothetical protein